MSMTNGGQTGGPMPEPTGGAMPQLNVLAQYIKDFSFENPNAPRSLNPGQAPTVNLQINVAANPIGSDVEVELKLDGKAEASGTVMFSFELVFAGMFRIPPPFAGSLRPAARTDVRRQMTVAVDQAAADDRRIARGGRIQHRPDHAIGEGHEAGQELWRIAFGHGAVGRVE